MEEALDVAKEETKRQAAAANKFAQEKLQINQLRDRAEEAAKIAQDAQRLAEQRCSRIEEELRELKVELASLKAQLERAANQPAATNDEAP